MTAVPFRFVALGTALSLALFASNIHAAETPLSDEAQALIAPVFAAYEEVDGLIGLLPEPGDVTEDLIRMRSIDRAGRDMWQFVDLSGLPEAEQDAAYQAAWNEISRRDMENQTRLKELIPEDGWFDISEYGVEGALAAFQIVQHASNDPQFQQSVLDAMEPLLGTVEVDGRAYGSLYDRLAMADGRYQRYGSQMICNENRWALYPTEDLGFVDERRREVGFDLSLEQNTARFEERPPCTGTYGGPIPQ